MNAKHSQSPRRQRIWGLIFSCLVLGSAFEARAQQSMFAYQAPQSCPTRAEFVALVIAKQETPEGSEAGLNKVLAAFRVEQEREFVATITFRPEFGPERRLGAATCADVVEGAALVIAMGLATSDVPTAEPVRPGSNSNPLSNPLTSVAVAPSTEADGVDAENRVDAPPPLIAPPPVEATATAPMVQLPVATATHARFAEEPSVQEGPSPWSWFRLGASGGFNNWVAPGLALEGRLFGEVEPLGAHWALRVVGNRAVGSTEVDGRTAHFDVWGGRLDLTPYLLGERFGWGWAFAAVLDLGLLRARGDASSKLANANSARFWWLAPGIALRLVTPEWLRMHLELQGEALVPLRRPAFSFQQPEQVVHSPAAVAFAAQVGFAVRVN